MSYQEYSKQLLLREFWEKEHNKMRGILQSYWDDYSELKESCKSQEEFNIEMDKARENLLDGR